MKAVPVPPFPFNVRLTGVTIKGGLVTRFTITDALPVFVIVTDFVGLVVTGDTVGSAGVSTRVSEACPDTCGANRTVIPRFCPAWITTSRARTH